jgi:hypothetical protein
VHDRHPEQSFDGHLQLRECIRNERFRFLMAPFQLAHRLRSTLELRQTLLERNVVGRQHRVVLALQPGEHHLVVLLDTLGLADCHQLRSPFRSHVVTIATLYKVGIVDLAGRYDLEPVADEHDVSGPVVRDGVNAIDEGGQLYDTDDRIVEQQCAA